MHRFVAVVRPACTARQSLPLAPASTRSRWPAIQRASSGAHPVPSLLCHPRTAANAFPLAVGLSRLWLLTREYPCLYQLWSGFPIPIPTPSAHELDTRPAL